MLWNIEKIQAEIGLDSEILGVYGCARNGKPDSMPLQYIGLSLPRQLDLASEAKKQTVKVVYRPIDSNDQQSKLMSLEGLKMPHVATPFIQGVIGWEYYMVFTVNGVSQWRFKGGISMPTVFEFLQSEAQRLAKKYQPGNEGEKNIWMGYLSQIYALTPITEQAYHRGKDFAFHQPMLDPDPIEKEV